MAHSKKTAAKADKADAKDGERQQMTDDGPMGVPVEEMSQSQRREVGKQLADGASFKKAVVEASGPADETGNIEKKDEAK